MSVSSLLYEDKEISLSCLSRCFLELKEKMFMRTLEVTQIRKHAQSRHPPSQQPLGCHAYEVPVLMFFPTPDPSDKNRIHRPPRSENRALAIEMIQQPSSRAGSASQVPALSQLPVLFEALGGEKWKKPCQVISFLLCCVYTNILLGFHSDFMRCVCGR